MAKILISGGAGFIASHIADALMAKGHKIAVIDNLSSGQKSNLPNGASFYELDILDSKVKEIIAKEMPDVFVHAAAQISVRESMEKPSFDAEVNVVGLLRILECFSGKVRPFFVFLSTGGALYGEQTVYPAPESHAILPTSIYGQSKRVGEIYLDFWGRELGLKYCVLRLGNVYGPRQNPHGEAGVVAIFTEKLLKGQSPIINGSGDQTRDYVYVGDVVRAVEAVSETRTQGTYNIGTGVETSVNALSRLIYAAMGLQFTPTYGPAKPGEQLRSSIAAALAKKTLAWEPKMLLEDGIKETVKWFKAKA